MSASGAHQAVKQNVALFYWEGAPGSPSLASPVSALAKSDVRLEATADKADSLQRKCAVEGPAVFPDICISVCHRLWQPSPRI